MRPVIAYHLILTTYGFWLPNDPRGSWSDTVRAFELLQFGHATKTNTHRSVANKSHDRNLRHEAKQHLARPPANLNGHQARAVARGFGQYVQKAELKVLAAVIMPDHSHLVVERHHYSIEQIGNLLKGAATKQLNAENLHPFRTNVYANGDRPSPWARRQWNVYLFDDTDVVEYVQNNPIKQGLKPQHWSFVSV